MSLWNSFYLFIPFRIITSVVGNDMPVSKTLLAVIFIGIVWLHYSYFISSKNFKRIYRKFEPQTALRENYAAVIGLFYFLTPLILLFL
jgi:hypothetical protein